MNVYATAAVMRHTLRCRTTKLLLCAAGAATLAATAMGSPAAASMAPPGVGSPLCNAGYTGTMDFHPALANGGTATNEEVELTMQFTGCSGGSPVPTAGRYVAKGIVTGAGANACANWFVAPLGTPPVVNFNPSAHLDGVVTWSPTSINASNVSFSKLRIYTGGGGHLSIRLPTAASLVTGSYVSTANLTLRTAQNFTAVSTSCTTGLPALKIVPANPASSISTGTW